MAKPINPADYHRRRIARLDARMPEALRAVMQPTPPLPQPVLRRG